MTQEVLLSTRDPVTPEEHKWLERALALIRFVRDPAFPGVAMLAIIMLAGFAVVLLAWSGAARTLFVSLQVPHLVSGGLGGLALIGLGAALLDIQLGRRDAALEQRLTDGVIDEVVELMGLAPALRARRRAR
jgi:hypothetical protein